MIETIRGNFTRFIDAELRRITTDPRYANFSAEDIYTIFAKVFDQMNDRVLLNSDDYIHDIAALQEASNAS